MNTRLLLFFIIIFIVGLCLTFFIVEHLPNEPLILTPEGLLK